MFNAESQERQHYTEKRHTKRMRMMAIDEKAGTKHQKKVAAATGNLIKKEEQASKSSSLDV